MAPELKAAVAILTVFMIALIAIALNNPLATLATPFLKQIGG